MEKQTLLKAPKDSHLVFQELITINWRLCDTQIWISLYSMNTPGNADAEPIPCVHFSKLPDNKFIYLSSLHSIKSNFLNFYFTIWKNLNKYCSTQIVIYCFLKVFSTFGNLSDDRFPNNKLICPRKTRNKFTTCELTGRPTFITQAQCHMQWCEKAHMVTASLYAYLQQLGCNEYYSDNFRFLKFCVNDWWEV